MADAVGGAFLSAFLQVLFDRLAKEHVLEYIRGRNIEKQVNKLERTLRFVDSFLNDAENKQYNDKSIKEWLNDLRNVVYAAEDVIDDVATEALRKMLESQTILRFQPRFLSNPLSKLKTIREIKKITQRFDELEQERSKLGLQQVAPGSYSSSSTTTVSRETTSLIDESSVYGRDGDKENIIDLLLSRGSTTELSVVPIVGMGGVGKTTLAQIVFNDNHRLKDHFTLKAWVYVSDDFDVKRITRTILNSVPSGPHNSDDDLNYLHTKLKDALTENKFLIVLDDVWDINYSIWDYLRQLFRVGAAGSAIIVTTRDGIIASTMGTVDNINLKPLSEDDCWSLFLQHAFRIRSVEAHPNLAKIGKDIVSKCKGLPLAVKSLGGHLCYTEEEREWKNILNSKIWEEDKNGIMSVLKLSYYYLKPHLKRCFAYCSIFPNDYEFEEKMVVLLWMAEGFLEQPGGKMDMEDFGRKCFRELLLRSFFQPSSNKKGRFVMHDLMNDLAQWVAGETCFRLDNLSGTIKISNKNRHSLRTFLNLDTQGHSTFLTNSVLFDLLSKLKFLRVLYLSGSDISELPSSIRQQKHLRYLDLSRTNIEILPDSITTLYNLQTLLLTGCSRLKKMPEEMGNLINLRHLDISNSNRIEWMPPRLGRLTSLRELSDFVVGKDSGSGIGELKNLKRLRGTLRISNLENVIDAQQAWEDNILSDKEGLNVLNMEWCFKLDDRQNENKVLEMLRPHEKLKEITILWYGGASFPTWLGDPSFSNMVFLKLYRCERCNALPPLGKLQKLKDLRIEGCYEVDKVGNQFYGENCSNPFPSLETLRFKDMKKWKHWFSCEIDIQVFPRLRKLSIVGCPELLGSLPDHISSLEKLRVENCNALTSIVHAISWHNCGKELRIDNCARLQYLMDEDDASASASNSMLTQDSNNCRTSLLEVLFIKNCPSLTYLSSPSRGELPTTLKCLNIENCPKLESIGERLLDNTSLNSINISRCENLKTLPEGLHILPCLSGIDISNCPNLVRFPDRGFPAANLKRLSIFECERLAVLPPMHHLTQLQELEIWDCPSIESFPKEGFPTNITLLRLKHLNIRTPLVKWGLDRLASLRQLWITGGCSASDVVSFLADNEFEVVLPSSLIILTIGDFPNLESLSSHGFQNLSSLEELGIYNCPELQSFPNHGLFPSLLELVIHQQCPLLKQQCEKDQGQEWPKISHVPQVIIDGKLLS